MRIYLIGFMGCGKSTTAKKLSAFTQMELLDIDKFIEKKKEKTVAQIFEKKGESYFRNLEQKILHQTKDKENLIISCGGGTPCFFDNMDWMLQNGITVYLQASTNFLFDRLVMKKYKRPLIANLDDASLLQFIELKLNERIPFYERAKIIYEAKDVNPELLMNAIQKSF